MRTVPARSQDTRHRILAAAGEVFAERGLRATTVRELSARARVNIAAIDYHFGGKEALYESVLNETYLESLAQHPPLLGVPDSAPGRVRLRAFIHSLLLRILDEGRPAWFGKLMSRELVEPTGALDSVVDRSIRPLFVMLGKIILDIAGRPLPTPVLHRCIGSVIGQCLFYKHAQPVVRRLAIHQKFDRASLDELATHIARFSEAAIVKVASDARKPRVKRRVRARKP